MSIAPYDAAYAGDALALLADAGPASLTLREDIARGELAGWVFLALDDGQVVGVLEGGLGGYCAEAPPGFLPPHARITTLEVAPAYRWHGIGRQLVAAFAAYATAAGRRYLAASVLTGAGEDARAQFFDRCGMPALIWSNGRHEVGGALVEVLTACQRR